MTVKDHALVAEEAEEAKTADALVITIIKNTIITDVKITTITTESLMHSLSNLKNVKVGGAKFFP